MLIILVAFAMTGCDNAVDADDNGNDNRGPNEVWMQNHAFTPNNLTVAPGTTVIWTNQDNDFHTVTSGTRNNRDDVFDSGDIGPGEQFEYTFNEPGIFDYFCIPHIGMAGTITVGNGGNGENNGGDNDDGDGGDY